MLPPFRNEPLTDFSNPSHEGAYREALSRVTGGLGRTIPIVIDGKEIHDRPVFVSINPGHNEQVISVHRDARPEDGERALEGAWRAFEMWKRVPPWERASVLLRAAAKMRARKHEFSAAMTLEAGKTWVEADADTAEAIDFLEFYAREAIKWCAPQGTTPYPDESNVMRYLPIGAGVAIPPWNFPVAIPCGMAVAPIVAGNTVVWKPAEQCPYVAWMVFELLREAGLPDGVLQYLPASDGAAVGGPLVQNPRTRWISFTGSKAVGCWISEEAGRVRPGQRFLKRVVAEMGGKDAILVDEDADADKAAAAIVQSAFGFSGQKCSACSRALVHARVYDEVRERVRVRTEALVLGDPKQRTTQVGPVIEAEAEQRILRMIDVGRTEGAVIAGGGKFDGPGHYVSPTVVADVDPSARVAQEEIFGPVLALSRVADFDEGVRAFNGTEYGLTGGYFGVRNLQRAREELACGNLYLNRKITGALVDVQPFGGFGMSGTDAKAGGREHLLLFLQGQAICERLG